jgi:hypothetical protein
LAVTCDVCNPVKGIRWPSKLFRGYSFVDELPKVISERGLLTKPVELDFFARAMICFVALNYQFPVHAFFALCFSA